MTHVKSDFESTTICSWCSEWIRTETLTNPQTHDYYRVLFSPSNARKYTFYWKICVTFLIQFGIFILQAWENPISKKLRNEENSFVPGTERFRASCSSLNEVIRTWVFCPPLHSVRSPTSPVYSTHNLTKFPAYICLKKWLTYWELIAMWWPKSWFWRHVERIYASLVA